VWVRNFFEVNCVFCECGELLLLYLFVVIDEFVDLMMILL